MPVIVRSGDTLSGIAARNGVSLAALMGANPQIRNANLIHPGERIAIPGHDGTSTFQPAGGQRYVVRPGDTLSAIGARFGVSYQDIARASGIANPNVIRAGQVLTIPGRSGAPTPVAPTPAPAPGPSSGRGADALNIARSVLGQNISSLKAGGSLAAYLHGWVPNNVCCANFVSACLQKAGLISASEHNDNVSGLSNKLAADSKAPWRTWRCSSATTTAGPSTSARTTSTPTARSASRRARRATPSTPPGTTSAEHLTPRAAAPRTGSAAASPASSA